jgi:iron complex outermembrane recepter protein
MENLYASAGVAYARGKNETEDTDLPEIPPLKGTVSLRYDDDTYFTELQSILAATQDEVDHAMNEDETSGWGILNLKAGFRFKGLKFFAGIENILDQTYSEHLSYKRDPFASGIKVTEPERVFYADVQYVF